jgi:cytochrome d ubiquinol oxidase subunit I
VIALSGAASGALVLAVNAWMQIPVGFKMDTAGKVISTDPSAIFRTYAWVVMSIHSTLACYESVPLLMAGIYAMALLKGRRDAYCRSAMLVCMSIGGVAAVLQPLSGDAIAKFVFQTQPAKFAAMEAEFETRTHAPMHLGGFPDLQTRTDKDSIEIPDMLSFLAAHDSSTRVTGLDDIPRNRWPNVRVVHWAFDLMAGCGTLIVIATILFWVEFAVGRQRVFEKRMVLWMLVIVGPLGLVALEAGWFVTELGRQPWIIQGIMLTKDAVTPSAHVPAVFFSFALLYFSLGAIVIWLVRRGRITGAPSEVGVQ